MDKNIQNEFMLSWDCIENAFKNDPTRSSLVKELRNHGYDKKLRALCTHENFILHRGTEHYPIDEDNNIGFFFLPYEIKVMIRSDGRLDKTIISKAEINKIISDALDKLSNKELYESGKGE